MRACVRIVDYHARQAARRAAFECTPCRFHVVFIRLREPGAWTQRLRKGVTKRCLALGIRLHWRTHTNYNDSAKLTEEIGQFFLATYSLPPCSSSGHVFNVALLRYRGEGGVLYVQHPLSRIYSQSQDVHKWKLLKRCSKSNAVPRYTA